METLKNMIHKAFGSSEGVADGQPGSIGQPAQLQPRQQEKSAVDVSIAHHAVHKVPAARLWPTPADPKEIRSIFDVTSANGFLPLLVPLRRLPKPWSPLEKVVSRLPSLLHDSDPRALAREVDALPLLQVPIAGAGGAGSPELLQALLRDYSILVSAYLLEGKAKSKLAADGTPSTSSSTSTPSGQSGMGSASGGGPPQHEHQHQDAASSADGSLRDRVPPQLGIPLFQLCESLGQPTIMEYSSYCLGNCYSIKQHEGEALLHRATAATGDAASTSSVGYRDYSHPDWHWDNLRLIRAFDGGPEEATFILIHSEIESNCGRLVQGYDLLLHALRDVWIGDRGDDAGNRAVTTRTSPIISDAAIASVITALDDIKETTDSIIVSQLKMFNASDPRKYEQFVRPWIFGWKGNPDFPHGVTFEGAGPGGTDVVTHLRGETGAQSTIIPSLDAVLGIVHKQDMLRVMLKELEAYRPHPHRQFLGFLRSVMWGSAGEGDVAGPESKDAHHLLRDYVQASGARALVRAYNRVVANVWAFRAIHVTFADAYIARYTSRENATGGTPYKAYLRKHRDESGAGQMVDGPGGQEDLVLMYKPASEAEYLKDLDDIFRDDIENGIPKHLMRRHEEIVARHGRNDNGETVDSLIRKSFPSQSWSAPAAEEVDLSAGSAGAGAAH